MLDLYFAYVRATISQDAPAQDAARTALEAAARTIGAPLDSLLAECAKAAQIASYNRVKV